MTRTAYAKMFRRVAPLILAVCLACPAVLWFRHAWASNARTETRLAHMLSENRCLMHPDILSRYNLSDTIRFGRILLAVDFVPQDSFSSPPLIDHSPLFESVGVVPQNNNSNATTNKDQVRLQNCHDAVKISVPQLEPKADASHVMFGVSTTLERLLASTEQMTHWLSDNGAQLLASVPYHPNTTVVQDHMRSRGIEITIHESTADVYARYFALVNLLYQARHPHLKWVSLIDDDTFFLSMPRLLRMLAKYDDTQPQYVGGLSEDFSQVSTFGLIAYGGAGIFLSVPLLEELNLVYSKCTEPKWAGDLRLAKCIYDYTHTKLACEPDLHQLDLHGDPSGFYESGRQQPLSIHHWKSWHDIDVVKLSMVSSVCGDACILQQVKFLDSWSLTSGYSLVKYGDQESLGGAMEQTWEDHGSMVAHPYGHSLSPLRDHDEKKVSFKMEDSVLMDGEVRQIYIHRPGSGIDDHVYEVIWIRF